MVERVFFYRSLVNICSCQRDFLHWKKEAVKVACTIFSSLFSFRHSISCRIWHGLDKFLIAAKGIVFLSDDSAYISIAMFCLQVTRSLSSLLIHCCESDDDVLHVIFHRAAKQVASRLFFSAYTSLFIWKTSDTKIGAKSKMNLSKMNFFFFNAGRTVRNKWRIRGFLTPVCMNIEASKVFDFRFVNPLKKRVLRCQEEPYYGVNNRKKRFHWEQKKISHLN